MKLKLEENDNAITVFLSERLSFKDHPDFNQYIAEIQEKGKNVTFDLSELDMIDSAGIGMLFLAQKCIEKNHGSFKIKGAQGQVKRIFGIISIDQQIELDDT